jgi:predicted phage terminase large subunit-like protein
MSETPAAAAAPSVQIPVSELVKLCAVDSELYCRKFFPKTFRQEAPSFAPAMWEPLEDPTCRLVNLLCFRGSGKTTRVRAFASKRIAYGISRTILCISASERHAILTVQWIRTQMEKNRFWAETFGLEPGRKWEETQIEINHTKFNHTVWVMAAGITGSLRGINFDDYRPDLIIVDDPQTDEMAATEEQREKVVDLMLGAVRNSLTPVTEEPNAKLVMAITPQHKEDVSQRALKDTDWTSRVFPCWTRETVDSPVDSQVSSWEVRFPTDDLRSRKRNAAVQNKLSIFAREMECRLLTPELSQFRPSWLNIRTGVAPRGCYAVLGVDPVPPPSERQMARGLQGKDWEAQYVWGRHQGQYHLLDCARNRGHEPSWSIGTALGLARTYRVSRIVVDAVAYQRTLKWLLEEEMKRRGVYFSVVPVADGMKKFARITNVLTGLATAGLLYVGSEHTHFIEQFEQYGPTYGGYDDDLDASALALQDMSNPWLEKLAAGGLGALDDSDVEEFVYEKVCP